MIDKRLERALKWCRKNRLKTDRLDKFDRGQKKKRFKRKDNRGRMINRQ